MSDADLSQPALLVFPGGWLGRAETVVNLLAHRGGLPPVACLNTTEQRQDVLRKLAVFLARHYPHKSAAVSYIESLAGVRARVPPPLSPVVFLVAGPQCISGDVVLSTPIPEGFAPHQLAVSFRRGVRRPRD